MSDSSHRSTDADGVADDGDRETESRNIVEAVRSGLHDEMARDEDVLLLGEDIGKTGGVFRATEGLYEEFGEERVVDTPLAEVGIVGSAIGLAASGLRPVAEIQFMGFMYDTVGQLFTRAARLNARSRGYYNCQMVLRVPFTGGIRAPDMHGESMEAILHPPAGAEGRRPEHPLRREGPARQRDQGPGPGDLPRAEEHLPGVQGARPRGPYEVPMGEASVRREGTDISVFTWGAMTRPTLAAAEELAGEIDVEVVDLRSMWPLDRETIVESFKRTGRAAVVHEAPKTGGLAGEITSTIQEEALLYQEAPVERITGYDVVYPLYDLEDYQLPNAVRVREGIKEAVEFP